MLITIIYTVLALLAFAGNSVLCRLALKEGLIDATSFSAIRLFSGIILLLFLVAIKTRKRIDVKNGSWLSAFWLFLYVIGFSYGYVTLDTGTGALIVFGTVQVTMIVSGFLTGNKLILIEWIGLFVAFLGLAFLLLPGASAPSLAGFSLMILSGIGWGFYSLVGRGSKTPLIDTANNFLRTTPYVITVILIAYFMFDNILLTQQGVLLAIASGAIMSGLGYAIWYSALPRLTVTQASIPQLSVPIIAAIGGVLFSNEVITQQLVISSILVLGGVFVVIIGKQYFEKS